MIVMKFYNYLVSISLVCCMVFFAGCEKKEHKCRLNTIKIHTEPEMNDSMSMPVHFVFVYDDNLADLMRTTPPSYYFENFDKLVTEHYSSMQVYVRQPFPGQKSTIIKLSNKIKRHIVAVFIYGNFSSPNSPSNDKIIRRIEITKYVNPSVIIDKNKISVTPPITRYTQYTPYHNHNRYHQNQRDNSHEVHNSNESSKNQQLLTSKISKF